MSATHKFSIQEIVNQIILLVNQKYETNQALLFTQYINQLIASLSIEDLQQKSIQDQFACLLNNWSFINTAKKKSPVRIYNPTLDTHGWQSNFSIIEIHFTSRPFLLDSVSIVLQKLNININLIANINNLHVERDKDYKVTKVYEANETPDVGLQNNGECSIYMEIDKQSNAEDLQKIAVAIENTIEEVDVVVNDGQNMRIKAESVLMYINKLMTAENLDLEIATQLNEIHAFMHWIITNHFTFLGYAEFDFEKDNELYKLKYVKDSGLGIVNKRSIQEFADEFEQLPSRIAEIYLNKDIIMLSKSNVASRVHRAVNIDFISIKILNQNMQLKKEVRFLGLYTSNVYNSNTLEIPYVNKKIKNVLKVLRYPEDSHDARNILNIIDNLPRDDAFLAKTHELAEMATNIALIKKRPKIKMLVRKDQFLRYFSCFVFIPRENYDSNLRKKIQIVLKNELHGDEVSFNISFDEPMLARIHFVIKINQAYKDFEPNLKDVESKVIQAARTWSDNLVAVINQAYKNEEGIYLADLFENAFGSLYQECFNASAAIVDIGYLCRIGANSDMEMNLYRNLNDQDNVVRLKIFGKNNSITLSEIVPVIENMGFKVINERPHRVATTNNTYWIHDYKLMSDGYDISNVDKLKDIFLESLQAVLKSSIDNDRFNKLVLAAKQNYHDVKILRTYYKYMWQTGLSVSQDFVANTLAEYAEISKKLINLFHVKFNPELEDHESAKNDNLVKLKTSIIADLDAVTVLSQDKIIRLYLEVIDATVRTNFFQKDASGNAKNYLSFKIESAKISSLPLPKPLFEIFVYAKNCEGIHLRASNIARGGIRWSDRHEDYRTEVLGLIKAQQVKNAVIVPLGAKGGFVVKSNLNGLDKLQQNNIIVESYKTFIRGLLDLTDNIVNNSTITPSNVVAFDKSDPYLVVAADKGTAKFSDIANSIAAEYNFWLGDAFASGGSQGYDHKKLAITSKGVFESVKLHFQTLDIDVENSPITVIGIGDMAGDVFGNGMLLSKNFKLVAAFNHMHIFLDPNPDLIKAFKERSRLFNLDYSSWEDYNPKLISQGGGVFKRTDKRINISPEVQKLFEIAEESLEPNELIKIILQSKVDLLWNGGIGTFVKASNESNSMVGDRANDVIRIDGGQLRVKVVAEGGNLGFTQLGRIEYAKKGGIINTDAIDNSGGVNCSDLEVNIKILLQTAMQEGMLSLPQRNELLNKMENEVVELVLANNKSQNEAVTYIASSANKNLKMHAKLMHDLENNANLNRKVEFLPSADEISVRQSQGLGFVRPELCVLLAYTKIQLKNKLLSSKLPDEEFNQQELFNYFPKLLHKDYSKYMHSHSLKRQIIVTKIVNKIIDEMGLNFINRIYDETGASEDNIARCYLAANKMFNGDQIRFGILGQNNISKNDKNQMIYSLNRLTRKATRWLIQHIGPSLSIGQMIEQFSASIQSIQSNLTAILDKEQLQSYQLAVKRYTDSGASAELAQTLGKLEYVFYALDIAEISRINDAELSGVAKVYFAVGNYLNLNWFRDAIVQQPVGNDWDALARSAFRDDVDRQQCVITSYIIKSNQKINILSEHIAEWFASHTDIVNRWKFLVNNLKATATDFTMFAIALRELLNLASSVSSS